MCERLQAAAEAAAAAGIGFMINARTDGFLAGGTGPKVLAEAVERANAYRAAGAGCLFVPGAVEVSDIRRLVQEIEGPVNVLAGTRTPPLPLLRDLGVRRVSTGGSLMRAAYAVVRAATEELQGSGSYGYAAAALPQDEMDRLLGG